MSEYAMVIGGPATGQVFAQAPDCTRAQLDAAVAAAADAFPQWRADAAGRRSALAAAAAALRAAVDELAPLLTREQGKPLREARGEIERAAQRFGWFAELRLGAELVEENGEFRTDVRRRPLGPVAAITPWNFPVQLGAAKVAPALAAGNPVVLKPSPYTPLTSLEFGRVLAEVLPPGVFNVVSGRDPLGEWLVTHPGIRAINFTGSVPTGRRVAVAAAADLKPVTLELGGNDPAIVLPDADIDAIADNLFWSAFANCGQICMAVKRVYVPAQRHDELVDALVARAEAVTVGDGSDPDSQLGPINNAPQLARVAELVADAVGAGATVATGGRSLDRDGYFYAPTVLTELGNGTRIVDEEQFGPALPIVRYTDVAEAVRWANGTEYGLCGSVWGADPEAATAVAAQLDCGTAWVNQHLVMSLGDPFAGTKSSGLGTSGGMWGIYGHTEPFVVHHPKGTALPEA
jgi:acyl-CoA reductase-like NAD-dependent aldehyde dehydrogenase